MQQVARQIAQEARLGVPEGSSAFWELLSAVKRAADEYASRNVDRANLQPVAKRDPAFADITATTPPPRTLTLIGAVEAFKEAPEKAGKAAKTKAAYRFRLGAWVDLIGADRPVAEISRAEIKNARDVLLTVPANAAKRFPGKTLREAAALATKQGVPPMHPKSARLYLDSLASLFKGLPVEGEILGNPALAIGVPPADDSKARRPMTIAELNRLFASGPYAKPGVARGWRWWSPLIALFQGLRVAEITGLMASDVCDQDGVPVILVRPNDARSLKTKQSARVVPVHPTMVDLGFVDFARSVPADGPLFTDLPGNGIDAANAAQKSLAYWFRSLFPEDRRVVFHSLRHTWTDALRNAYVPRDIAERLGGWKASGSAYVGYGSGHRPSLLAAEIARLKYEGLDLKHLR
jgi:integrase